jgi:serine protease
MPYVPDLGASCGANYVNAAPAGNIDGVTIVGGHEFSETITDQNPGGGWLDSKGFENSDKCAWVGVGGTGGAQNLVTAVGTFAMQANWSNDVAGCQFTHAIVTTSNQVVAFSAATANQSSVAGTPVSLQMTATSTPAGPTITYSATGLPVGLSIAAATGLISGTPTTNVTNSAVVVTATDSTGASATSSFTWTVTGGVALTGLTPTFAAPVATATGFTAKVSNYSASYTWTCVATVGSCTVSTAGTVTVTGVSGGVASTATVTTTRSGYTNGTGQVTATALFAAVNPTLTAVRTGTTLVVTITNYNNTFAYTATTTRGSGTISLGVITITGVTAGRTATVTVKNTKAGYVGGTASITG